MGRPKALDRKQQLLEEILEYLRTRTLASVTFRTLADALGVSSYVLVYQFGNREALINDIVREVDYRVMFNDLPEVLEQDFDVFEENTSRTLRQLMTEENRHLLRLQMEAATMDVVAENPKNALSTYNRLWTELVVDYLTGVGLKKKAATAIARSFVSEITGIRFDFVLNGDEDVAGEEIEFALKSFRGALERAAEDNGVKAKDALKTKVKVELEAQAVAVKNRPNPAR